MEGAIRRVFSTVLIALMIMPSAWITFAEDATDGKMLKTYRAKFDEETAQLSFETSQRGEFVITALNYDDEEYFPEFYDELGKVKGVQLLIMLVKD